MRDGAWSIGQTTCREIAINNHLHSRVSLPTFRILWHDATRFCFRLASMIKDHMQHMQGSEIALACFLMVVIHRAIKSGHIGTESKLSDRLCEITTMGFGELLDGLKAGMKKD